MPEAVTGAPARSPIGRSGRGWLGDLRPAGLAATIIRTALDKVPELDPRDIDDLYLGCGLPGGEEGFNMGRVVAPLLGYGHLPAATLTRYCASSLQTTRMAFHAIRAGEGDVFVSAGVECVSRYARGSSDGLPPEAQAIVGDWRNPVFEAAWQRSDKRAEGGAPTWHDPREDGAVPDIYLAMGQTAENLAQLCDVTREDMDEFGVRSQNLAEEAIKSGFWAREITPVTVPSGDLVALDDGPRPGVTRDAVAGLKPVFRPDGR